MKTLMTTLTTFALTVSTTVHAAALRNYEASAKVATSAETVANLKRRLGYAGAPLDTSKYQSQLRAAQDRSHVMYSSIFFKDLVASATTDVQYLLENGTPLVFNPDVEREERIEELQKHRNNVCFEGLKKAAGTGKVKNVIDAVFAKVAKPELDELAKQQSTQNSTAALPTNSALESAVATELRNYLQRTVGTEQTAKTFSALGQLKNVDVANGQVFRLRFQSEKGSIMMSLAMLMTFVSGEDEAFISTLDCMNQVLLEQKRVFSFQSSGRAGTRAGTEIEALLEKYLEGEASRAEYMKERVKVLDLTQYWMSMKLQGAIEANRILKMVPPRALRALLVAFLDFQKNEIPEPTTFEKIALQFEERLKASGLKPEDRSRIEAEFTYYRSISHLIGKLDRSLDLESLRRQQLERDKQMLGIR